MSSVWPSGGAFFTATAAMAPLAPPRLSTTTVVPSALPSGSASMRAAMSVVPPGAVGTTSVTGLSPG